jgi:hypothetical protein
MKAPLCFVLMPFGQKPDPSGGQIDFDAVYRDLIAPAVLQAGLEPIRADEEIAGGFIHKPMFERLLLCQFAVADLTTANANVFYELGIRHAVLPGTTVLLHAGQSRLPFDVAPLRTLPYDLALLADPDRLARTQAQLALLLQEGKRAPSHDSPIFQLLEGYPDIKRLKTDLFRERVEFSASLKEALAGARRRGIEAVRDFEQRLGDLAQADAAVVIDLYLSYRAVKGWKEMIALVENMSPPLAQTVMVQEQLALALNREGQGDRAEKVLLELLERRGRSSETYGILGRVYKDRWENALRGGHSILARGLLDKAIDAYLKGFETDWRDAYPGINAATLMTLRQPPDERRAKLLPVVIYAAERRIARGQPDYWDYATLLEAALLARDETAAAETLSHALAHLREPWEAETTRRNLRLIREAREKRGETEPWMLEVEQALEPQ